MTAGPSWAYAFVVAAIVTLAGTPLLRRVALVTAFVDHPVAAAHKSHKKPTPYLGGIGLIVAVLLGLLFTDRLTPQVGVITLGGSLIGCLGLLDDHRSVGPTFRFTIEVGVAAVALAAGIRIHATDVAPIDGVITVLWIVGVTNSVNLLDNMDGVAAGVSAAAAIAIFCLAVLGEQLVTATIAAGLAGACAGFLAHNKRPASIFMGDTGSLFLGFVLAVAAIDVSPALTPPASFAVPLMLLALPVLDTVTVTFARLRRGRSVSLGGRDHLSHRLVARGLSPGGAVGLLVGGEGAVGLAAVLAGRDVIPLPVAALASAVVLASLANLTLPAKVYVEPVIGLPTRLRLVAAAGVLGVLVLAAPAALALVRARNPGISGANQARAGLAALDAGDPARAAALFDAATADLDKAHDRLGGGLNSLGLLVPVLRANLATTRAVVAAGREVSAAASNLSALVAARSIALNRGPDVVDATAGLDPALDQAASALNRSVSDLAGYDRPYLWPSLGATVRDFRATVIAAATKASTAATVARALPALLGGSGTRHYFLALEDNAELRGGGGLVRYWGEIEAAGGQLRLTRFGTVDDLNRAATGSAATRASVAPDGFLDRYGQFDPTNTWQNVNVSPDFAVTGQVIAGLYPQSGGDTVDGVVAVDIPGLAALVGVSGPVHVQGWPEPLTAANLADVVLRDAAVRYPADADRRTFLANLYRSTVESVLAAPLGSPASLSAALAPAVRGGHLLMYGSQPGDEQVFGATGMAGHVAPVAGDSVFVVDQNLTATQVDAELARSIGYDVHIDPGTAPASVRGTVTVTLDNAAAGDNRTYLSVYSPLAMIAPPSGMTSVAELGRRAYSTTVTVPARSSRTVTMDVQGHLDLPTGNWYRLDLPHQPTL
ncbi:MAG TPA: DUF4012 domain-containing protein, partial [Acidimicrobiales bacterium]|nr:DUF4012 domain-containing protein [Acidimicrobiales bacterium]